MSDSATPWTAAYQAPQSMEFSRQEYWSGLPFPSPGDLPDPGIEPKSPTLQARTHRRRTRLESKLATQQSRGQHSVGGHPREVRSTVTPSEGKESDSIDSRKIFIILMF